MKKIILCVSIFAVSFITAQSNAFKGSDFENFGDFTSSLNSYGLKPYATQDAGAGIGNSSALKIEGTPSGNDYIFTSNATENLPEKIKEITFMVKGKADKSLSVNLYKTDGSSYKFNIGDLKKDSEISDSETNNYSGIINTKGNFVKVTLKCSGLKDINKNSSNNFFALKVGKDVNYKLEIDDVKVITAN